MVGCHASIAVLVQSGTWKRYSAPDPVQGLLLQVKRDLGIDIATEFMRVSTQSGDRHVFRLLTLPTLSA